MKKKKVYLYPKPLTIKVKGNQYMNYFEETYRQCDDYQVIGKRITGKEPIDLLFNSHAQLYIVSWIESIVFTISGKLQFLFAALLFSIFRLCGKQVIWVFHNKHPHCGNTAFSRFAMRTMAHLSNIVVTHSSYGEQLFNQLFPRLEGKCRYIPHPVYDTQMIPSETIDWDYIIWGEVNSRKGIVEFLEYANQSRFFSDKRILICGKCNDSVYASKIQRYCNNNVSFVNRFIEDDELKTFIQRSAVILFTYSSDSVLSSGSLIYSLNFCKPIIGPNTGSFAEMAGIVTCYDSLKDIEHLKLLYSKELCLEYIEKNQWMFIPQKIDNLLKS